jgi:hypothetical protein
VAALGGCFGGQFGEGGKDAHEAAPGVTEQQGEGPAAGTGAAGHGTLRGLIWVLVIAEGETLHPGDRPRVTLASRGSGTREPDADRVTTPETASPAG